MRIRAGVILLSLITLALTACGGQGDGGATDAPSLEGTEWVLLTLNGQPPLPGTLPTAAFTADQINGTTGCNHYFGSYEAAGGTLTIREVGMTEMYCMDPAGVMEQEQQFLSALTSVTAYRMTANRLELLDSSGAALFVFGPPTTLE